MQPTEKSTTSQPQATAMKVMSVAEGSAQSQQCEHKHQKASRLRGGGAGKDCFLGLIGCFICCECFEGCCDCVGDIICCPCEMCC